MDVTFTTLGAVIGLVIAIVLIIKKVNPAYSLILGALIGGLIGGGGLEGTVTTMVNGAGSMMSSVLRILTSGILAGALIKTGSAQKIAETIVDKLGERRAVAAIAIATMIICAVGVFIDISVITVAPIALAIGERAGLSKSGVLIARYDRRRQGRQHYLPEPEYDCRRRGLQAGPDSRHDAEHNSGYLCTHCNDSHRVCPDKAEG